MNKSSDKNIFPNHDWVNLQPVQQNIESENMNLMYKQLTSLNEIYKTLSKKKPVSIKEIDAARDWIDQSRPVKQNPASENMTLTSKQLTSLNGTDEFLSDQWFASTNKVNEAIAWIEREDPNSFLDDIDEILEENNGAEETISTKELDKYIASLQNSPHVALYCTALYHLEGIAESGIDVTSYKEVLSLELLKKCALADIARDILMFEHCPDKEAYEIILRSIGIAKGLQIDVSAYMEVIADFRMKIGISPQEAKDMEEEYLVPREKEYASYLKQLT